MHVDRDEEATKMREQSRTERRSRQELRYGFALNCLLDALRKIYASPAHPSPGVLGGGGGGLQLC